MTHRSILREHLRQAWRTVISERYHQQLIDSEASLQVHFGAALLRRFEVKSPTFRIFVEPTIRLLKPSIHKKPDLVICNQRRIIGMVELKYVPRARAAYRKDLETLEHLSKHRLKFEISNARYLGPQKATKRYGLAADAVLCWAGVYSGRRIADQAFTNAEAREDFLALHALTSNEAPATIVCS